MTDERNDRDDDTRLEAFFAAARSEALEPSADLLARIALDAQDQQRAVPQIGVAAPRRARSRQLFEMLGGWPAIGGLVAATMAGIWIGVSPPAPVAAATDHYLGMDDTFYIVDLGVGAGAEFVFDEGAL